MEHQAIIDALIERSRVLPERSFRAHRICRDLARFPDDDAAYIFEMLYRGAVRKKKHYQELLESFVDFGIVREHFGRRLTDIFDFADNEGLILAAEWLAPLPIRQKTPGNLLVHQDLSDMTLGERKWHARKADPNLIEKLLVDPDPAVIHNLLNHPRLVEREVVRICAKRPNHPRVLWEVFLSARWFSRYNVKKAIVSNPAAPPRLVMLIIPTLSLQDLKNFRKSRRFSPGFIRLIISIYKEDPETPFSEDPSDTPDFDINSDVDPEPSIH